MTRYLPTTIAITILLSSNALAANLPVKTTEQPTAVSSETLLAIVAPVQMGRMSPELRITQRLNGSCFAGSLAASGRSDAWRCTVKNTIYDPCFGNGDKLVCLSSPWSKEAVQLTVTKPLPADNSNESVKPAHGIPWGLELANGEHCTLLTGATSGFAGMRANYACGKDGLAYGDIDKSRSLWKVFYQADDDVTIKQVPIVSAWY